MNNVMKSSFIGVDKLAVCNIGGLYGHYGIGKHS
jgi:hypothetical protein